MATKAFVATCSAGNGDKIGRVVPAALAARPAHTRLLPACNTTSFSLARSRTCRHPGPRPPPALRVRCRQADSLRTLGDQIQDVIDSFRGACNMNAAAM